jgi:hypothetical protein
MHKTFIPCTSYFYVKLISNIVCKREMCDFGEIEIILDHSSEKNAIE